MIIKKIFTAVLLIMVFLPGYALPVEEVQYFLNIPGVSGGVQKPGLSGWIRCHVFQYLLPGIPAPTRLIETPPEKPTGFLTAIDVGKPYASFSKPLNKIDSFLSKSYKTKRQFPQWEFALSSPAGEVYMRFIFKDIVISAVRQRDQRQYVTFKFGKVIWNYTGIKNKITSDKLTKYQNKER